MTAEYGPLENLIGTWKGDKGLDIAPDPDEGTEENPFYETMTFEGIGDVRNAESQVLAAVRYRQEVYRKLDGAQIHDQTGYWLWDAEKEEIIHSIAIPRGVCVLAGGKVISDDGEEILIEVSASSDNPHYTIVEAPFMSEKASTKAFECAISFSVDKLHYKETTLVDIYGEHNFEHIDENYLTKV